MGWLARARRRVDRRYYRAFYALARALFPTDVGPEPIDATRLRRILVLPNYKVGDLVVATPALAFLREAAPQARLDVLVSPRNASLLDGDPRVDTVLLHDPLRDPWLPLARRLRRGDYDLVADFVLPHHLREGLLTAYVAGRRAARLTPFRPAGYWGFFTHRPRVAGFDQRYMAERMLYAVQAGIAGGAAHAPDLVRYPLALAIAPDAAARVDRFLAEHVGGPFVAFNVWASDATRTLDPAQAAEILATLAARHPELSWVLTPPPGYGPMAAVIAADARTRVADPARIVVSPPSPHLPDLVALLERAVVVFSPDTGTVHVAAGVARPVVVLFTFLATQRPSHWIPHGVPHRIAYLDGDRPLREMPPDEAVAAFDALWASLQPAARAVPATA